MWLFTSVIWSQAEKISKQGFVFHMIGYVKWIFYILISFSKSASIVSQIHTFIICMGTKAANLFASGKKNKENMYTVNFHILSFSGQGQPLLHRSSLQIQENRTAVLYHSIGAAGAPLALNRLFLALNRLCLALLTFALYRRSLALNRRCRHLSCWY